MFHIVPCAPLMFSTAQRAAAFFESQKGCEPLSPPTDAKQQYSPGQLFSRGQTSPRPPTSSSEATRLYEEGGGRGEALPSPLALSLYMYMYKIGALPRALPCRLLVSLIPPSLNNS